ncbi:MAG: DUF6198 family protein [Defluviitaleaceae bacterium]|nr:DUF6198 family protein [Defluviitaleaceae bacterium]
MKNTKNKIDKKILIQKILIYITGLFTLAMGVSFTINSNLGISPVSSFPFSLSLVSGLSMGNSVNLFFGFLILLQFILLRKNFKLSHLSQIVFSFIFGFFTDFTNFLIGNFSFQYHFGYIGQLLMLIIGIIFVSFGVSFYLEAKLISLPPEGIIFAIMQVQPKWSFHKIKIIFDCLIVVSAILITFIFLGNIYGIREGTVISAIAIGKLIPYCKKFILAIFKNFNIFTKKENQNSKET